MRRTRTVSVHELKRRLMRRMSSMNIYDAELLAVTVREHAAALCFLGGRSIADLCNDTDHGAAWDHTRMEQALRNRARWKA